MNSLGGNEGEERKLYDVVVVGGGPAGLTAALYTARGNLRTLVLDRNPSAGALGIAGKIENYPGLPVAVTGLELLEILRSQAMQFGAEIITIPAVGVNFGGTVREIMTAGGNYFGRTAIIATGSMARKPGIEGEAEYIGRGVSYCAVCDAAFFRNREVAAVGNVNLMHEELDFILKLVRRLTIVSPSHHIPLTMRRELRENPKIDMLAGWHPVRIYGNEVMTGMRLRTDEGEERDLPVSGAFLYLQGQHPVVDFLYGAVPTEEEGCIRVNRGDMSTPVEGVFAAGDVTCKKIRQVVIAAGEGCSAALSAERYINQKEHIRRHWW
jgi:thioredoxin reductase (NADPH)